MKTGTHLKEYRDWLGLSQEKFGGIIDYSGGRIGVVERDDEVLTTDLLKAIKRNKRKLESQKNKRG